MLVYGHECNLCGFVGDAVPLGPHGEFVGCPQCHVIEDIAMDIQEVSFTSV